MIGTCFSAIAQGVEKPMQKNTFFLELGGNGMFYSLNYDRIFFERFTWKLSGRIGAMYLPGLGDKNRHMIGLPIEVSYLRGRNNHHLEIGLGFTSVYDTYPLSRYQVKDLLLMGVAWIGYRHQKREGGMFYKVGFTPLLGTLYDLRTEEKRENEFFSYPLVGLAIGYTLKR
jgi:hypothetical protein